MDFEIILKEIGIGKYQVFTLFAYCLSMVYSNMPLLGFILTAYDVNYRCAIPECESPFSNETFEPRWLANASTFETLDSTSRCFRYAPTKLNRTFLNITEDTCPSTLFDTSKIIECSKDKLVFQTNERTIVNEFGLFCEDNTWKILMVGTVNSIGQGFGYPVAGIVSDKFGRKIALVAGCVLSALCAILQSFSTSYSCFVILEGLNAFFGVGLYGTALVMAVELTYASKRGLASGLLCAASPCAGMFLAFAQMKTQNWRLTLRYCYTPGLFFATYYWLLPESIRWMSSHGQHDKVVKILNSLAKKNNVEFSDAALKELVRLSKQPAQIEQTKSVTEAFLEIFNSKELVLRFLVSVFCWIALMYLYFGMSVMSVTLSDDRYLAFILALAVEIPGVPLSTYMIEILGRKLAISLMCAFSGVAFLIQSFELDNDSLELTLFILAKIPVSMAINSLIIYTLEMYPTELRQSLVSICCMIGILGFTFGVVNPELAVYWRPLPIVLFAVTSFLTTIAIFATPETKNRKLPDTVRESVVLEESKN